MAIATRCHDNGARGIGIATAAARTLPEGHRHSAHHRRGQCWHCAVPVNMALPFCYVHLWNTAERPLWRDWMARKWPQGGAAHIGQNWQFTHAHNSINGVGVLPPQLGQFPLELVQFAGHSGHLVASGAMIELFHWGLRRQGQGRDDAASCWHMHDITGDGYRRCGWAQRQCWWVHNLSKNTQR